MSTVDTIKERAGRLRAEALRLQPGLFLAVTVAMAAMFLSTHYGAPVMLFALLLGMTFNSIKPGGLFDPGVVFASKAILRIGVALLGARITFADVTALGSTAVLIAVVGVSTTIALGFLLARLLKRDGAFGVLTGGSVGICGASAALALSAVLPKRGDGKATTRFGTISEQDTIFAVLAVTTLSTIAMVFYPIIATSLGFSDVEAGIFIGGTVHDVAQVVGAGYTISVEAGDTATITKLIRVALLVPVVTAIIIVLARSARKTEGAERPSFPPFLIAFIALVAINSFGLLPQPVVAFFDDASRWALVTAISALGMKTALSELVSVGPKALVLIVAETAWIAAVVLLLLMM